MQGYSPFRKPIGDLQANDLMSLRDVEESWYVEYKRQLIEPKKLAKALAAFANTYGGWLFIGVEEPRADESTRCPGIFAAEVEGALNRLRNTAAANVNPIPFFRSTVLSGPCTEMGLDEGKAVIAIEIPRSVTAPHVHRDGRIYVRVDDGSETPESDRFVLDQLWRRGEPRRESVRRWIEQDPAFDDSETMSPYIRVLLCVDPWGQRGLHLPMTLPELRRTLSTEAKITFDVLFPTNDGFLVRQVGTNPPRQHGLMWRIKRDLSADLLVPLPIYQPSDIAQVLQSLDGYRYQSQFTALLEQQRHEDPQIVDLNFLFVILRGIFAHYRTLLASVGADKSFYFKARMLHTERLVPFVDVEAVVEQFMRSGVPVVFDETITVPPGHEVESFGQVGNWERAGEDQTPEVQEELACISQAVVVFMLIAESLGVSPFTENEDADEKPQFSRRLLEELLEVAERAMEAQSRRQARASAEWPL